MSILCSFDSNYRLIDPDGFLVGKGSKSIQTIPSVGISDQYFAKVRIEVIMCKQIMRQCFGIALVFALIHSTRGDIVVNSGFSSLQTSSTSGKTLISSGSTTGITPQGAGFYFTTGPDQASYLRAWRLNSMTVALSTKFLTSSGSFDSFNGTVSAYLYKVNGSTPAASGSLEYISNTGAQAVDIASSLTPYNLQNIDLTGLGTLVDGQYVINSNTKYLVGLNFTGTFGTTSSALYVDQSNVASSTSLGWAMGGTYQQTTGAGAFNSSQTALAGTKNTNAMQYDLDATAVPELGTMLMFGAGVAIFVGWQASKRRKEQAIS